MSYDRRRSAQCNRVALPPTRRCYKTYAVTPRCVVVTQYYPDRTTPGLILDRFNSRSRSRRRSPCERYGMKQSSSVMADERDDHQDETSCRPINPRGMTGMQVGLELGLDDSLRILHDRRRGDDCLSSARDDIAISAAARVGRYPQSRVRRSAPGTNPAGDLRRGVGVTRSMSAAIVPAVTRIVVRRTYALSNALAEAFTDGLTCTPTGKLPLL